MVKTDEINEAAAPAVAQLELVKDHMNYELVDKEVAQYANEVIVEIDDETNKRLKKMIDKRIMAVMIVTYLIQTLDKGTLSYASIMGIQTDLHLHGQQVSIVGESGSKGEMSVNEKIVLLVDDHFVPYYLDCGISGMSSPRSVKFTHPDTLKTLKFRKTGSSRESPWASGWQSISHSGALHSPCKPP